MPQTKKVIPRALLKNGKQNREAFQRSEETLRESQAIGMHTSDYNVDSNPASEAHNPEHQRYVSHIDDTFSVYESLTRVNQTRLSSGHTAIMKELNILKDEVSQIKLSQSTATMPSLNDLSAEVANLRLEINHLKSKRLSQTSNHQMECSIKGADHPLPFQPIQC